MSAGTGRLVLALTGDERPPAELPRSGVLVVGSDPDRAGFRVEGQGVAGVHCAIGRVKGGGWALKDLGSDYGTLVNGERVQTARLAAGDEILIGSRRLQVVDADARPAGAPAPARPATVAPPGAVTAPSAARASTAAPASAGGERGPESLGATGQRVRVAIPGHRIVRPLGRGGMGQVVLAVQESLDREVAVKVLAPKLAADRDFVLRFQAEARAAAALNHPNVVHVYDVGEEGGLHFLTMEYMDQDSLEERLAKEGRLSWREVLDVLHDAASALVYAEARGIVHRDIKPANLMRNAAGTTKLADLGLATHLEAEATKDAESTSGKRILGTPHFLAPEVVRGQSADARSDLYSLGATAYRLLTARNLFEGATTKEILRGHLFEEPRPVRELAPDVPPDGEALIARLVAKEPAERYPSASVLLREVARLRSGAPAPAPPGAGGAGGKRGLQVGAGIAVVLALALVLKLALGGGGDDGPGSTEPGSGGGVAAGGATGERGTEPDPTALDPTALDPTALDPADAPPERDDGGTEPGDDDRDLKLREANAKVALLELDQRGLAPEELRTELLAIAERFPGTTTATAARERAEGIDAELLERARLAREREAAMAGVMAALERAAALERDPPSPSEALRAMEAVPDQAPLATDADFRARRAALRQRVIDRALEWARAKAEAADRAQEQGEFERTKNLLVEIVDALTMRELPTDPGLERVALLQAEKDTARDRIERLDETKRTWRARRSRADSLAIAEGLGAGRAGTGGLAGELARLELGAAATRLDALLARLETASSRALVEAARRDVELAAAALALPGREFAAGTWRRKSVSDPRGRRSTIREAAGADAEGLRVETPGGVELVPWSAFGTCPNDLHQLFYGRLARDWTSAEREQIAALTRLAATARALEVAAEMFDDRAAGARFSPGEAADLVAGFAHPIEWSRDTPLADRARRAREAAALLGETLVQASEGAFSTAVAGVERLLDEYESALLVLLLSDGRDWSEPPAPAAGSAATEPPR